MQAIPRRETIIRASDPMDTQSGFRFWPVESGCSRFCVVMVGVPEAIGKSHSMQTEGHCNCWNKFKMSTVFGCSEQNFLRLIRGHSTHGVSQRLQPESSKRAMTLRFLRANNFIRPHSARAREPSHHFSARQYLQCTRETLIKSSLSTASTDKVVPA
jgi:hypothetical protein